MKTDNRAHFCFERNAEFNIRLTVSNNRKNMLFLQKNKTMLSLNFEKFDPDIGTDGYCRAIRDFLFPNSDPTSIDAALLRLDYRIYPKRSVFSRVRLIRDSDYEKFSSEKIIKKEFLPPNPNVVPIPIGRFNREGERKLYLADHPYVALRECGIKPGDYFLFSYFAFNADMRFIDANPNTSVFSKLLADLFKSKDERFYDVINHVFEKYLSYEKIQGIAYESVKVPLGYKCSYWENVNSVTNLATINENIPSADLVAGWFAKCDENYCPILLRIFIFSNQRKKNKSIAVSFEKDEYRFRYEHAKAMKKIKDLSREATMSIQEGKYRHEEIFPFKFSLKD